jgi:dual specificity tyrosine-phosphorylation-regulated kinase 2/3/4
LRWDPDRRLKPSEAVSHPFVTNQPFHQRPGIPDEARRAARVRSTAAVPSTSAANGQGIPSPVKRAPAGSASNTFAQQTAATPARERARALPETPQTALRNGVPAPGAATGLNQGSPVKVSANSNANRRHSTVATAGAAAMAGSKRASNGAVLAGQAPGPAGGVSMQAQQRGASGNLAQMAASAAAGGSGSGSGRWRG